ncbi:hypothetical protein ATCC90586_001865 [Pythium insidiosum]|nr:hypothetical protein ATCC90586_001865 [Pythium insidiosum]
MPPPPPPAPVAPASAKEMAQARTGTRSRSVSSSGSKTVEMEVTPPATLEEIFSPDGKVDMRLLMISLWKNRKNEAFTAEICQRLSYLSFTNPTLDQVEFYLPQLAHMVIHFEKELPMDAMEQFVLLLSQSSVHLALQLFWIIYAALDENRPKRSGNPKTFARCAQLLLALEQCLVYGSPVVREAAELFTRNSISRAEMEQILAADRRFFAAQSSLDCTEGATERAAHEGWLFKKGGGTSTMGRRNWKRRWCRIEKRILLVFAKPSDEHPRTSVALDRAEVVVVDNPKHPFYFELIHEFSETKMKFAAQSHDELVAWVQHLRRVASIPEPPPTLPPSPSAAPSNSFSPSRALVRMSVAMRSFLLQPTPSSTTESASETATPNSSPTKIDAVSPPSSPKACAGASAPFGSTDAWSQSMKRTRAVSSMSSASANSSEAGEASGVLTESSLIQSGVVPTSLSFDQHRRYEFFTGMITFVKAITDVSEALRRVEPPAKRKAMLRPRLEQLKIPTMAYIPLCKSTDPFCRVLSIFSQEGRVFSTNERAPCMLFFDTEETEGGGDVSNTLFDYLYADELNAVDDAAAALTVGDDAALDVALSTPPTAFTAPKRRPSMPSATTARDTHTFNYTSPASSPFLRELLSDDARKERVERIFGELGCSTSERLRSGSKGSVPSRWRLCTLISKSHDDLRQEVLVMQLISYFQHIFALEGLPLWLHPYRILSTGASTGLIEVVRNAVSLDGLKKTSGFKNLRCHFEQLYGSDSGDGAELLRQAELNFVHSLAAYSIVCYILSIKDRHNGNIMLDVEGHLVHIDFGFFLGRAPGGSFSFETAPFKLTTEMVDVLGGRESTQFQYFSDLCVRGALAARKHADTILTLVEVMSFHSKLPCFAANASVALAGLRERLFLTIPEDKVAATIVHMIERSYDHFGTNKYDQFQVYSNGIAK